MWVFINNNQQILIVSSSWERPLKINTEFLHWASGLNQCTFSRSIELRFEFCTSFLDIFSWNREDFLTTQNVRVLRHLNGIVFHVTLPEPRFDNLLMHNKSDWKCLQQHYFYPVNIQYQKIIHRVPFSTNWF